MEQADQIAAAIDAETLSQTSGRFLSRAGLVALDQLMASAAPGEVTESDLVRLRILLKDSSIKLRSYKAINTFAFWPAILAGITGAIWPVLDATIIKSDLPGVSGLVQTLCVGASGTCIVVYAQYKRRQRLLEDMLRRTIVIKEPMDAKFERWIDVLRSIDTGMSLTGPTRERQPREQP